MSLITTFERTRGCSSFIRERQQIFYMANTTLTLQSSNEELKAYFEAVCKIVDSNTDEFPINLDEVWPLCYGRKSDAVEALAKDFLQDVDYKVIRQNPQNPLGGRPVNEYHLSTSCFEFFIARKVRPVFEVYRRVFHAARKGELRPKPLTKSQQTLEAVKQLCEIAQQQVEMEQRQIEMESEQKLLAQKVSYIEEVVKPNGFMSVMGFANINRINIGEKEANSIGRLASKWCNSRGIKPEKVRHSRYGGVNTYPMDALYYCFTKYYPNIKLK